MAEVLAAQRECQEEQHKAVKDTDRRVRAHGLGDHRSDVRWGERLAPGLWPASVRGGPAVARVGRGPVTKATVTKATVRKATVREAAAGRAVAWKWGAGEAVARKSRAGNRSADGAARA